MSSQIESVQVGTALRVKIEEQQWGGFVSDFYITVMSRDHLAEELSKHPAWKVISVEEVPRYELVTINADGTEKPRARITREARNDNSARGNVEFWIESTDESTVLAISSALTNQHGWASTDYMEEIDYGFGCPFYVDSDEQASFRADFQTVKKQILSS